MPADYAAEHLFRLILLSILYMFNGPVVFWAKAWIVCDWVFSIWPEDRVSAAPLWFARIV